MDILFEVLSALVLGIVTQRYREEKDRKEWALVSRKPDKKTGNVSSGLKIKGDPL